MVHTTLCNPFMVNLGMVYYCFTTTKTQLSTTQLRTRELAIVLNPHRGCSDCPQINLLIKQNLVTGYLQIMITCY